MQKFICDLKFIKILILISSSSVVPKSLNSYEKLKVITDSTGAITGLLNGLNHDENAVCQSQDPSADTQEMQRVVLKMPRNSLNFPMQWFEMHSTSGWGKMLLIMGYEDNRIAFLSILDATVAEDQFTTYHCSAAN